MPVAIRHTDLSFVPPPPGLIWVFGADYSGGLRPATAAHPPLCNAAPSGAGFGLSGSRSTEAAEPAVVQSSGFVATWTSAPLSGCCPLGLGGDEQIKTGSRQGYPLAGQLSKKSGHSGVRDDTQFYVAKLPSVPAPPACPQIRDCPDPK